jgi:predicted DNA binding CopG/RHH family protein
MELSDYVGGLRRELASITRFAGDDITRAAEMLTEALDSSVRLTLLEVLSAAAAEITALLDDTTIDVRLSSSEPEFVVTRTPEQMSGAAGRDFSWSEIVLRLGQAALSDSDDAGTSRITLRLSESLKAAVETQAAAAGLSVNSWLVRAAAQALDSGGHGVPPAPPRPPHLPRVGKRLTGRARS